MIAPQLIVFDFDGTLVDTRNDIADAVNRVRRDLDLPPLDRDRIFQFVGRGVHHLMERSLADAPGAYLNHAIQRFMEHYEAHLMDQTGFFPNGRETLASLEHKSLAILSNKPERFIRKILKHLDGLEAFGAIVGGDTLENKKPDPQGLFYLMAEHGLPPEKVLMVGDSLVDLETGRRAGVPTCGVSYGHAGREALAEAGAGWIIDNLAELPGIVR